MTSPVMIILMTLGNQYVDAIPANTLMRDFGNTTQASSMIIGVEGAPATAAFIDNEDTNADLPNCQLGYYFIDGQCRADNLVWGGQESESVGGKGGGKTHYRPQHVKFTRCKDGKCESCPGMEACGWTSNVSGWLQLDTQDGYDTHVAEMWIDCATGGAEEQALGEGEWHIKHGKREASDNEVKVYLGGVADFCHDENGDMSCASGVHSGVHGSTSKVYKRHDDAKSKGFTGLGDGIFEKWSIHRLGGKQRLRVVVTPANPSKRAAADIHVIAEYISPATDSCMNHKLCLSELASSPAGDQLRQKNADQLKCLQQESMSAGMNAACQRWTGCLEKNKADMDMLKAMLEASATKSVQWSISKDSSGSCDAVCNRLGGTCSQQALDDLGLSSSNQHPEALKRAYESATGADLLCRRWNTNCAGGNCANWGLPFIHANHFYHNECWGGDAVAPFGKAPVDGHHRRLCPCELGGQAAPPCANDASWGHYCGHWTGYCSWHSWVQNVCKQTCGTCSKGLLQTSKDARSEGSNDEITGACINPLHDDPESWECDCAEALRESCGADPSCIRTKMCNSEKVCQAWKNNEGRCSGLLLSTDADKSETTKPDTALDELLTDKRSC